jgi:hypothetical protein
MDSYMKIAIFALVGAICAIVIAGGLVCMVSEQEPSSMFLSAGAAAGGALGSAVSYAMDQSPSTFSSSPADVMPDMKVGMPTF